MLLDLSFYWITRLDALHNLLICFITFGVVVGVVALVVGLCFVHGAYDEDDTDYKAGKILLKTAYIALTVFVIGIIGDTFIPTTKEYCAIKLVDYLENNEKARELPDKIIDKAYEYFDNELKADGKEKK